MRALLLPVVLALGCVVAGQDRVAEDRAQATFSGKLMAGEGFTRRFGPDFQFEIRPNRGRPMSGWTMRISRVSDGEDLSALTPPLYGPRWMYLDAWHFLPDANAPKRERQLIFSPDVGRTVTWASLGVTQDSRTILSRIEAFGRVELVLTDLSFAGTTTETAALHWITFSAAISWPDSYRPAAPR